MNRFQTVVTATVASASRVDGLEAAIQQPSFEAEEEAYLNATVKESYEQTKAAARRLVELLDYETNRKAYKKRTECHSERESSSTGGRASEDKQRWTLRKTLRVGETFQVAGRP